MGEMTMNVNLPEKEHEEWVDRNVQRSKFARTSVLRVRVTPGLAEELMRRNEGNRAKSAKHVRQLSDAIKQGHWIETGDTVKIDSAGRLVDGQHRLSAVILAQRPVMMDFAFGVAPQAFDRIDTGINRTHGQLLSMVGVKNGNILTSATRILFAIKSGQNCANGVLSTKHEVVQFVSSSPELIEAGALQERLRSKVGRTASPGGITAAIYLIRKRVGSDMDQFIDQLTSGVDLAAASPILLLRNKLIRNSNTSGRARTKTDGVEIAAVFIKAFNAWHSGKTIERLMWRPADEAFPEVGR